MRTSDIEIVFDRWDGLQTNITAKGSMEFLSFWKTDEKSVNWSRVIKYVSAATDNNI